MCVGCARVRPLIPRVDISFSAGGAPWNGGTQPEPMFANPDVAKDAEKAAVQVQNRLNTQALPIRQYLETTVVPILMQARDHVAERLFCLGRAAWGREGCQAEAVCLPLTTGDADDDS